MDTKRFELTLMELGDIKHEHYTGKTDEDRPDITHLILKIIEAQVDKVLSMLEPVQLEALTFDKEQILGLIPAQAILDYNRAKEVLEKISQATNLKNQDKGQLYRLKEEQKGS